jgi:hypothetical protein
MGKQLSKKPISKNLLANPLSILEGTWQKV